MTASAPRVSEAERLRRWRLVLGGAVDGHDADAAEHRVADAADGTDGTNGTDGTDGDMAGTDGGEAAGGEGVGGNDGNDGNDGTGPSGGRTGREPRDLLRAEDHRVDAALGLLYDRSDGGRGDGRAGGLGRSRPRVVRWLGDIRAAFPTPVVQMLQRDAVDRLDLRQLLLEPELLATVEPDVHLVTVLVELNRLLPDETRATARRVIGQVLADLERRLADRTRQALRGALSRAERTRAPRGADIDWPRTIGANLRHWLPEEQTLVPEHLLGHGRRSRSLARDVVIAVDQSGSMAESVVYASLFAGVLAQLPTLRTSFVAFDTAVTDLTPYVHDPVEVLFGVQLGGGTDIAGALGYCRQLVERPERSVLFLVSDLYEGGNPELMRRRVGEMIAAGVQVVVLLALADEGAPAHDHSHAEALAALGADVLAATPGEFPELLGRVLA